MPQTTMAAGGGIARFYGWTPQDLYSWQTPHAGGVTDRPELAAQHLLNELADAPAGAEGCVRRVELASACPAAYEYGDEVARARRTADGDVVFWPRLHPRAQPPTPAALGDAMTTHSNGDPGLPPRGTAYGPLDALYAAVRRQAPTIGAECVSQGWLRRLAPGGTPSLYLRVRHGPLGPWTVAWDPTTETFTWHDGPEAGARLGRLADVEHAADDIARILDVPTTTVAVPEKDGK